MHQKHKQTISAEMFKSQNKYLIYLKVIFVFCMILICVTVLYIEKQPHNVYIVIDKDENVLNGDHLLNVHGFTYVLNSGSCTNQSFALLLVTSYAGDIETRSAVRQAYSQRILQQLNIKRVFLLALIDEQRNTNRISQAAIENESKRFGDIIQGNFIEDYRNLTYKHVMGLKWAVEHCGQVPFIIKMDHDIAVDLFSIVTMLKRLPRKELMLAGYLLNNMKPIREPANKWYVTQEEYPRESYPDFLSGWLYITNPHTAELLCSVAEIVPYFWIDDTYVTGLLAEQLGLPLVRLNKYFTTHPEHLKCCMREPQITCDFWVGPNGGETKLLIHFQRFAEACYKTRCKMRSQGQFIRNHCMVQNTNGKPFT